MSSVREVPLGTLIKPAKVVKAGSGTYPILSMTMHQGLVDQNQKFKKTVASKDLSGYKVVKRGQLVVSFPIDEGVLDFQQLYDEAIVSPAYGIWDLIEGAEVDINYLGFMLRSERSLAYYRSKLQGSTARRRSLPRDVFLALPIELPDLEEQKRFVQEKELLSIIQEKREHQQALFEELRNSLFHKMFLSKELPTKKLLEIANTSSGATPSRKNPEYYENGKIPWVKSGELHQETIYSTSELVTDEALENSSMSLLPSGTILIAMYGATAGTVSELGIEATTNQAICSINLKDSSIKNSYLKDFLRFHKSTLLRLASGGAQANISQTVIKNLDIPIPSLEDQENYNNATEIILRFLDFNH